MLARHHLGLDERQWASLPLSVRIMSAAALFMGGRYGKAQAPFSLGEWVSLPPGKGSVCSTFTGCILAAAYPDAGWTAEDWRDLQIMGPAKDSPMFAVMRRGIGDRVADFQPGRWHLVQGWRHKSAGHQFFVRADPQADFLQVVQSTSVRKAGPTVDMVSAESIRKRYPHDLFIAVLGE